jgi:putative transposase
LFTRTADAELLLETLFRCRDQGLYLLHGFAIMPDHLHVLLTPSRDQTIERCMQCIKGGFSFQVRQLHKDEVWQQHFHEHRVRDVEDFRNQLAYIASNPERRGLRDYRFVHTRHPGRIDPMPAGLAV